MEYSPWDYRVSYSPFQPFNRYYPHPDDFNQYYPRNVRMPRGSEYKAAPSGSWLDGPKVPGPSSESISNLHNPTIEPVDKCLGLPTEQAYGLAYKALQNYKRKTMVCLETGKRRLYPNDELPFMVFNQLDEELFRSVLRGNVYLAWSSKLSYYRKAITFKQGKHQNPKNPRITIKLSTRLRDEGDRMEVVATLIHQMIHAYYLQCCGFQDNDGQGPGYNLGHDVEFHCLIDVIAKSVGKCWPNDEFRNRHGPTLRYNRRTLGGPFENHHRVRDHIGGSNCVNVPSNISDPKCKDWSQITVATTNSLADHRKLALKGKKKKETKPSPSSEPQKPDFYIINGKVLSQPLSRSDYEDPPETYIEIRFGSKAIPLSRGKVSQYLESLSKLSAFTENRVLTLPPGTTQSSVILLCHFLQQDLNKIRPAPDSFPTIDPNKPPNTIETVDTISAYFLALDISLPLLATHCLSKLSATAIVADPIAVLEAIYYPQPHMQCPDPQIRQWTMSWLSKCTPCQKLENLSPDLSETNKSRLCEYPCYKARYQKLYEKNKMLAEDLDKIDLRVPRAAKLKSPETPLASSHYHFQPNGQVQHQYQHRGGQDPRYQPYVRQPIPIWQDGIQTPKYAGHADLRVV